MLYNDFVTRLTLSLLGTLQIVLDEQPLTKFGSINTQGLLIYLALHAERPVSREMLTALFWPEEGDSRARANLRQNLHQLRKLFGDLNQAQEPFLLVTRHDVQFNPQSDYAVDVQQFMAAIEDHDLETAAALYRGDLLPGFTVDSAPFEEWLRQERESLHNLALVAMYEHTQDLLGSGSPQQARTIALRQINLEPWRETAHRQLMQAYALGGDRANALAQFEVCRRILQDELGIEPAPETTALYEEIISGRYGPRRSNRQITPPQEKRHNLPAETMPLIGRENDLVRIKQLFRGNGKRLVTIFGPGGIGKSRLALAAGFNLIEHFPDGVFFVDLAPTEQAFEIPTTISSALKFQVPDRSQDIFPQLLAMLKQRELLLILDNFEQLYEGTHYISKILQACPDIALIVTSRQGLNLAAESRYELSGLTYSNSAEVEDALTYSAVQLFLESGRRLHADFTLDENNLTDVLRICRQVQGMPLGLLLAAAWLELLSPAEIAVEIEAGLDFLTADLADLPSRQRSMQAVFQQSWDMLAPQERAVLARLSIFRGGFTRQAAEQVAEANLRVLLALINKSLIQKEAERERFIMHELLRQFAAQHRQLEEKIELLHCRYFAQMANEEFYKAQGLYPFHLAQKRPHESYNFLRAWEVALEHGLAEELIALFRALIVYEFSLGNTGAALQKQAIGALQQWGYAEDDPAMLYFRVEEVDLLESHSLVKRKLVELLEVIRRQGDPGLRYLVLSQLVYLDHDVGQIEALNWSDEAVESALASKDELLIKQALAQALWLKVNFGVHEESDQETLRELLAFFEPDFPDSFVLYRILGALARHALSLGDFEGALYYGKRGLNLTIGWRDLGWISWAEMNLAAIGEKMDRADITSGHILDCLEWHLAIGERWQTLGFLFSIPLKLPQLVSDNSTAVSIISSVYHHQDAIPKFREQIFEALPNYEEKMGPKAFSQAWEEGKELGFDTAVAMLKEAMGEVRSEQGPIFRDR